MEPEVFFEQLVDANGRMVTARWRSSGAQGRAFFPAGALASARYGNASAALHAATSLFALAMERAAPNLSVSGIRTAAGTNAAALAKPFRDLQRAGMDGRADDAAWRTRWLTAHKVEPVLASEIRRWAASQKPDVVIRASHENQDVAAALIGLWEITGLAPSLRPVVENRLIELNLRTAYVDQSIIKPSVEAPLQSGIDTDALDAKINLAMAERKAATDEIDLVEMTLNSVTDFVAATADIQRIAAFELLQAA